jgi:hypothetical protein
MFILIPLISSMFGGILCLYVRWLLPRHIQHALHVHFTIMIKM